MAQPDDYLRGWVDQLVAIQDCMAQINTDTDPALRKFCAQKPSDLLLSAQTQTALGICANNASGLAIPGSAVANSATFRALLDTCYRPLVDAIVGLMWPRTLVETTRRRSLQTLEARGELRCWPAPSGRRGRDYGPLADPGLSDKSRPILVIISSP